MIENCEATVEKLETLANATPTPQAISTLGFFDGASVESGTRQMADRIILIFGASCVGKTNLRERLAKELTGSFIGESDEIKEVWAELRGKKEKRFSDYYARWHSDIQRMEHRKDYSRILAVALRIIQDVDTPVVYFASRPEVAKEIANRPGVLAVFLTASEGDFRERANKKGKSEKDKEEIIRRDGELRKVAKSTVAQEIDTSGMPEEDVFHEIMELINRPNV